MTDPFARLDERTLEEVAKAVHDLYLRDNQHPEGGGLDRNGQSHPAMVTWDQLAPSLKKQNYDQVRENVLRLFDLGYLLAPGRTLDHRGEVEIDLSGVVEALARDEHDRWCRLKRQQGYVWGLERQDDGEKGQLRHPDLTAWEDLDDETREKDRRPIRAMVEVFRDCDYSIVKRP